MQEKCEGQIRCVHLWLKSFPGNLEILEIILPSLKSRRLFARVNWCSDNGNRGGARNLATEGLGLPTGGGAKMTKICSFHTLFCQICSNNNLKFYPMGGG